MGKREESLHLYLEFAEWFWACKHLVQFWAFIAGALDVCKYGGGSGVSRSIKLHLHYGLQGDTLFNGLLKALEAGVLRSAAVNFDKLDRPLDQHRSPFQNIWP